jgi:hypothetical protein
MKKRILRALLAGAIVFSSVLGLADLPRSFAGPPGKNNDDAYPFDPGDQFRDFLQDSAGGGPCPRPTYRDYPVLQPNFGDYDAHFCMKSMTPGNTKNTETLPPDPRSRHASSGASHGPTGLILCPPKGKFRAAAGTQTMALPSSAYPDCVSR